MDGLLQAVTTNGLVPLTLSLPAGRYPYQAHPGLEHNALHVSFGPLYALYCVAHIASRSLMEC